MEISAPSDKGLVCRCCGFDQLSEKLLRLVVVHVMKAPDNGLLEAFFWNVGDQMASLVWERVDERSDIYSLTRP